MSSGLKQLIVNPLERAISNDIMRAQSFSGAMLQELLRAALNTTIGADDANAGGLYIPNTTQGNPVSAQIYSGLLFAPSIGGTGATVSAGVVSLYDPDTSPSTDDSQYKLVEDPGTSLLSLTQNSSGSIRIDIIECSRVQPDNIIETDSRDIFNTVTGLFAAATVNKVSLAQLQYRIRTGAPGSGFPGTAQGWLPLAVASVPTGTTVWDTVTVWDVRPLISDNISVFSSLWQTLPRRTKLLYSSSNNGSTNHIVNGVVELNFGTNTPFRIGGNLRRGSPGTDASTIDFSDSSNQEASINLSGSGLAFYYLMLPFNLPRWARYTGFTSGSRIPRSPRGIPVLSRVAPEAVIGNPSGAITLPAVYGFNGAATGNAICYGATSFSSGVLGGQVTSAGKTNLALPLNGGFSSFNNTTGKGLFTLTENSQFPAGATRVRLRLTMELIASTSGLPYSICVQPIIQISIAGSDATQFSTAVPDGKEIYLGGGGNQPTTLIWNFEIELPNAYPNGVQNTPYDVNVTLTNGNPYGVLPNLVWTQANLTAVGSGLSFSNLSGNNFLVVDGWTME